MSFAQCDVVVVGAGCAGLTAAVGLARAGFTVAVVEAAPVPGAGGGLGGVLFAENLVLPEILGEDGVEALAWERRLVERGSFVTDGRRLAGTTYRDADAFRHCYTVLSPIFNHHLAQVALGYGAALLTETTAESLIRDGRRVIGIATSRGPLYGDLIFLAEGDAGHLVHGEGFDRHSDPRDAPSFLYCLQQVLELPPGAIEECFGVGPEQGVAHDVLLRNPTGAALNMRAQVCANRQSVTLSVALPAEHLGQSFGGEPRQLLDRVVEMPVLRPWWREGRRGAWTVRLLRTGGPRDVPYLVADGLAVGGAGAGLGVDFPVMNLSGPATATALLLCRAAASIRAEGGDFRTEQLLRHYVEPLRQTHYWRDQEFLHRWPGHVRRTRVLFDRGLDVVLDSSAVWARPGRWLPRKLLAWFGVIGRAPWGELWSELIQVGRVLRLREVTPRPAAARVVLDGALNAFRDLARRPRPHLPPAGALHVHFSSPDEGGAAAAPVLLRRWFDRFRPVLASTGRLLYDNGDIPLSAKMTTAVELLVRQINLLDLLAGAVLGIAAGLAGVLVAVAGLVFRRAVRPPESEVSATVPTGVSDRRESAGPVLRDAPSIRVVWKTLQPLQRAQSIRGLPHVCPTGVFEARLEPPEAPQVFVHAEKCIRCEACWRTHPPVDWARGRARGLRYPVFSPVVTRLLTAEDHAGMLRPTLAWRNDPWPTVADHSDRAAVRRLLDQVDRKLDEFDHALAQGPAVVDRARGDHLEMLARYAQQLAVCIRDALTADDASPSGQASKLAAALVSETEQRARRTWDGRFARAAADGRRIRQHHLTGLRRLLGLDAAGNPGPVDSSAALRPAWIAPAMATATDDACVKHLLADIAARRFLLETLEGYRLPADVPARAEMLAALARDVDDCVSSEINELKTCPAGSLASPAGDRPPPEAAYRSFGLGLLADSGPLQARIDVPGDWTTLAQRRALSAEREEIRDAEHRLAALAAEWCGTPHTPEEDALVGARFARQTAHVLGGKLLLWRTHARLEEGLNAELAVVLLRVWLDHTSTLLAEFTIAVRDRLRPPLVESERPLVEPGTGAPLRSRSEYFAASAPYTSGEFLLDPIDLLRPQLVPEMVGEEEATPAWGGGMAVTRADKPPVAAPAIDVAAGLSRAVAELRGRAAQSPRGREDLYLAETLALETAGRLSHPQTRSLMIETAAARLILSDLNCRAGTLHERCVILRELAEEVVPRWQRGDIDTAVRHLGREVLELEALKADFRRSLMAAWEVFGAALGRDPNVQASCFALAEAAAWLKAADSTLGRLAWLGRLSQAEERDESPATQEQGRRVLAHCRAEIRERLSRFGEDIASLRRGYYAPHVRAASLLLAPRADRPAPPPAGSIERPLRVLVVVEPAPAEVSRARDGGTDVLESCWMLGDADRAAVETALRLRDAAPEYVHVEAAAFGPIRVGQTLREILSLGIEPVHLAVQDRDEATPERAAAALAAALTASGSFDLVLGGDGAPREKRLAVLVAEAMGLPWAGHAAGMSVLATVAEARIHLLGTAAPGRERSLPAAVLIESGTPLRPFTIAGYLAGLRRGPEVVSV